MLAEAVTLIGMASFAASAIGSKAIGDGAAAVGQKIITHFRETLPGQQEFIREIRKAQLNALRQVARRNDQALKQLPSHESASEEHAFSAAVQSFITARLKTLSNKSIDFDVLTGDRIQDVLDFMVHPSPDATLADLQTLARNRAEAAIIEETEADAGRALPSRLRHLIEGTGGSGWYDFFSVEVNEQLKTNERFKSVFLFAELAGIKQEVKTVGAKIDSVPDETVAKLLAAMDEREKASAREAGVREEAIIELARRADLQVRDFDSALSILEDLIETAIEVRQEGARGSNLGDFVDDVLARVAEKTDEGDFEAARTIADDAVVQWEREQAEQAQKGLVLFRTSLRQAELALDTSSVAEWLARIAELEHPGDRAAQRAAFREHWGAHEEDGRIRGNPFALKVAVAIADRLLETAGTLKEKSDCCNLLGIALKTLGERAGGADGVDALNRAVDTFGDALQVGTRADMPADWAMTKNNLANALSILGQRAGGADGIDALNRAVAAYEDALQIRTRADMPADWAITKSNLGNALSILGERTGGADGIEALKNAVVAYEDALQVCTRADMPAQWAGTKNSLGSALKTLGERAGGADGIEALNRAVDTFGDALQVYTRADMPADWAMTKNNLANALKTLGERAGGANGNDALNRAVKAYEDALQIYTRAHMPADWAMTKNNLANALKTLGGRAGGADGNDALKNAVDTYEDALQIRTRVDMPADWAMTKSNLGNALKTLGQRTDGADGIDVLNRAVTAFEDALQIRTRADMPADWALTKNNLANAFSILGERVGGADGIDSLKNAISAYEGALTVFTMETAAHYAEGIGRNLVLARAALARLQGGD
ncbi:MAG: hypothetical protein ABJO77_20960 [Nisaea sp.]|uniref:hypothetical protein n=1 Tax=Nisaea sp. TaxID=2024842 RepID=UPI0032974D94